MLLIVKRIRKIEASKFYRSRSEYLHILITESKQNTENTSVGWSVNSLQIKQSTYTKTHLKPSYLSFLRTIQLILFQPFSAYLTEFLTIISRHDSIQLKYLYAGGKRSLIYLFHM